MQKKKKNKNKSGDNCSSLCRRRKRSDVMNLPRVLLDHKHVTIRPNLLFYVSSFGII